MNGEHGTGDRIVRHVERRVWRALAACGDGDRVPAVGQAHDQAHERVRRRPAAEGRADIAAADGDGHRRCRPVARQVDFHEHVAAGHAARRGRQRFDLNGAGRRGFAADHDRDR
jgi:hypothetical protein